MSEVQPLSLTDIRTLVRRYTHTNEVNYPDATLDADVNRSNGEIWMMILEAEGYKNTGGDFKVQDLLSTVGVSPQGLGYNGEYPFPSLALTLNGAEISYGNDYYKAEIIDKSNTFSSFFNEDEYNTEFSKTNPKIFVYRDSYFIRPTFDIAGNITDGIKLSILARQDCLVDGDDTPQFETNFHHLLPLKVAQDFALIYPEKANQRIDVKIVNLESQVISFYQDRVKPNPQFQVDIRERGLNNW